MLVELRQAESLVLLDRLHLDDPPQPGRWMTAEGQSYLVLQRKHRYQLRGGRYQLFSITLLVKRQRRPDDAVKWGQSWVIGDPSCRFNARSPLLRCAVLPAGPCELCSHHDPR